MISTDRNFSREQSGGCSSRVLESLPRKEEPTQPLIYLPIGLMSSEVFKLPLPHPQTPN